MSQLLSETHQTDTRSSSSSRTMNIECTVFTAPPPNPQSSRTTPRLLLNKYAAFTANLHIWRPSRTYVTWHSAMLSWQGVHLTRTFKLSRTTKQNSTSKYGSWTFKNRIDSWVYLNTSHKIIRTANVYKATMIKWITTVIQTHGVLLTSQNTPNCVTFSNNGRIQPWEQSHYVRRISTSNLGVYLA